MNQIVILSRYSHLEQIATFGVANVSQIWQTILLVHTPKPDVHKRKNYGTLMSLVLHVLSELTKTRRALPRAQAAVLDSRRSAVCGLRTWIMTQTSAYDLRSRKNA